MQTACLAFERIELLTLATSHRFLQTNEETSILFQRTAGWVTGGVIDDQLALATDDSTRRALVVGASVAGAPFDRAVARSWVLLQICPYEACEPVDSRTLERFVTAAPLVSDAGLVVPAPALVALSAPEPETATGTRTIERADARERRCPPARAEPLLHPLV